MQERHSNRDKYFIEQGITTRKYVIPFISQVLPVNKETTVLEIGCGEGGNLMPFVEAGCRRVVGIDIAENKIANAKKYLGEAENAANVELIADDVYNADPATLGQFDIILTRDVLEHIHGQEKFMAFVQSFLKPEGKFFLGFPPWQSPFGGHQQICVNKTLAKLPYYHVLPKSLYRFILKSGGETSQKIETLMEIKDTAISIERFERILRREKYQKDRRTFYLINPNYEIKFGMKPREAPGLISAIPYLRNFLITTNYYLISKS